MIMTGLIPEKTGSIHPLVWSKAARGDRNFVKNHLSAHFRISSKTAFAIIAAIALFFLSLVLMS
jgi:hypothetical protein